jgi:hypothetical protein
MNPLLRINEIQRIPMDLIEKFILISLTTQNRSYVKITEFFLPKLKFLKHKESQINFDRGLLICSVQIIYFSIVSLKLLQ